MSTILLPFRLGRPAVRVFITFVAYFSLLFMSLWVPVSSQDRPITEFNFRSPDTVKLWIPFHDIGKLEATAEGVRITITGRDPYMIGPSTPFPAERPLFLTLKLKSETGGLGQVFWFNGVTTEKDSVRFSVRKSDWQTIRVVVPPLPAGTRFRFDPPGDQGVCVLESIAITDRSVFPEPQWNGMETVKTAALRTVVSSGLLTIDANPNALDQIIVRIQGRNMAQTSPRPQVGYVNEAGKATWFGLGQGELNATTNSTGVFAIHSVTKDPDGCDWTIDRSFSPGSKSGTIRIRSVFRVSKPRNVLYLPTLTLFAGANSFGAARHQAILPGVEYLDGPDTSSSTADIEGPESKRLVPDTLKLTIPMAAIEAGGQYLALSWKPLPELATVFDSPDRHFQSGGHLMGTIFPGSHGSDRDPGSLTPYAPVWLIPEKPLVTEHVIYGGLGNSVLPAVQVVVEDLGLPALPKYAGSDLTFLQSQAAAYLHSKLRVGEGHMHAYPLGGASPQIDAAVWTLWLAQALGMREGELPSLSKAVLSKTDAGSYLFGGIGHVRKPVAPLLYGHVEEALRQARSIRKSENLRSDGTIPYPTGQKLNFARTHFEDHANGFAAPSILRLLQSASLTGNADQINDAIAYLHTLDRYEGSVPRGAQTWEVPLHTPDILASANLVAAYTLGFELSGDPRLLQIAKSWAWSGVPFVYLIPPTDQEIGIYSTIPVLGATQWVAPNWMGLPVQWCGLVYAESLFRLGRWDPKGPWSRIAAGITLSGMQQVWPSAVDTSRVGLLPDSFSLREQTRNDAAINPGTLLSCVTWMRGPLWYDFRVLRKTGAIIHAAGEIKVDEETSNGATLRVTGWSPQPHRILIVGIKRSPRVWINGAKVEPTYMKDHGTATVMVTGSITIRVEP